MAWTYSGDPSSTPKDAVRFLVGDTDSADQLLSDGEIAYVLSIQAAPYFAASQAAKAIAAKFARLVSGSDASQNLQLSDAYQHYLNLSADLKRMGATSGIIPYAGGISISDKQMIEADADRVRPSFTRNLHVMPGSELGSIEDRNVYDPTQLIDVIS